MEHQVKEITAVMRSLAALERLDDTQVGVAVVLVQ
jgi:hypothetical protein